MVTASRRSLLAILAARVLLLAAAGGALIAGVAAARTGAASAEASYVCPMHPTVRSASPDDGCPICGMALEPEKSGSSASTFAAAGVPRDERGARIEGVPLPGGEALRHEFAYSRMRVGSRVIRGPAWLENRSRGVGLLYRDDAARLSAGEEAWFVPAARPAGPTPARIEVRLGSGHTAWDDATTLVSFRTAASAASPGRAGFLELAPRICREIVVPPAAILRSPAGPYVLVVGADDRTIARRPVDVGSVSGGYAAVISGLAGGERVATMNAFFLDAELRLVRGATP